MADETTEPESAATRALDVAASRRRRAGRVTQVV